MLLRIESVVIDAEVPKKFFMHPTINQDFVFCLWHLGT